jgi:hypothetical protein
MSDFDDKIYKISEEYRRKEEMKAQQKAQQLAQQTQGTRR